MSIKKVSHLSQNKNEISYGTIGWKEFHNNRKRILNDFDIAKGFTVSHPVKSNHGLVGEEIIRNWLSSFLPKKYGVTSGYIISDIICEKYQLKHFDILIYDSINAPVLWVEPPNNKIDQNAKMALPSKFVFAAMEIKSSLQVRSVNESLEKLHELDEFSITFPKNFSSWLIFFDLDPKQANNKKLLPSLLPENPIIGFRGGIILRCSINENMSGLIRIFKSSSTSDKDKLILPIVKNIDDINISRSENGELKLPPQVSAMFFDGPDKRWYGSKQFSSFFQRNNIGVGIDWSLNSFSRFAIDLLLALEGRSLQYDKYSFGLVFEDRL